MKKLLIFIPLISILASCGNKEAEHSNKNYSTKGCLSAFAIGGTEEKQLVTLFRVDSVIDDVTPEKGVLMPNMKFIKLWFHSQNTTNENKLKLNEENISVFDTKTNIKYEPTLRYEQKQKSNGISLIGASGFAVFEVPITTNIADLTVGLKSAEVDTDPKYFIALKPIAFDETPNKIIALDSVIIEKGVMGGEGDVKITLKSITTNFDGDAYAKELLQNKTGETITKIELELELLSGEKGHISNFKHVVTPYRVVYCNEKDDSSEPSIEGSKSIVKRTYYVVLWQGETINYISDSEDFTNEYAQVFTLIK